MRRTTRSGAETARQAAMCSLLFPSPGAGKGWPPACRCTGGGAIVDRATAGTLEIRSNPDWPHDLRGSRPGRWRTGGIAAAPSATSAFRAWLCSRGWGQPADKRRQDDGPKLFRCPAANKKSVGIAYDTAKSINRKPEEGKKRPSVPAKAPACTSPPKKGWNTFICQICFETV
jgi:hypothetical protein